MAKRRDTMESLRKRIVVLENEAAALHGQLSIERIRSAQSLREKAVLVRTIESLAVNRD